MSYREWLAKLVKDYIHSEWANFRRLLNEPAAKEELLSSALLYSYQVGTSVPAAVYSDTARTTPYPNPVVFTAAGNPPGPIVTPEEGCDLALRTVDGRAIATMFGGLDRSEEKG